MAFFNTNTTYGSVTKFFHWLMAILVIGMLIYGSLLGYVPKAYQATAYNVHKLIGLTILTLIILRLLWALINPKPVLPERTTWFEYLAVRAVHWAMYVAVIAMPLFGWIGSVAIGRAPKLGAYVFTLPIEQDKALSSAALAWHELIAWVLFGLIVLHLAAAFYHHFILKDDVLRRMLPGHHTRDDSEEPL